MAEHNIDDDRALCVATGSQDAIAKAFDALLDADDALLVESPTYSGALAYLNPLAASSLASMATAMAWIRRRSRAGCAIGMRRKRAARGGRA